MSDKVRVRAVAKGYYANRIQEEDSVFAVKREDAEKGATWFITLDDLEKTQPKREEGLEKPETQDAALRLTNSQLESLLRREGIKFNDGMKKLELVQLLFNPALDGTGQGTNEEDLV